VERVQLWWLAHGGISWNLAFQQKTPFRLSLSAQVHAMYRELLMYCGHDANPSLQLTCWTTCPATTAASALTQRLRSGAQLVCRCSLACCDHRSLRRRKGDNSAASSVVALVVDLLPQVTQHSARYTWWEVRALSRPSSCWSRRLSRMKVATSET